ncbi:MAG: hypothetical protein HFJ29_07225 [Clostridia bacterium]|nr:hypothetical protein [Clostridia bacterium]
MKDPFSLREERHIAEEIFNNFKKQKIICGIKDEEIKINLKISKIWLLPLLFVSILFFGLVNITSNIGISFIFSLALCIIVTIICYLLEKSTILFKNNELILVNGFGYKKIIDISKEPRIFATYREHEYQSGGDNYYTIREKIYKLYI